MIVPDPRYLIPIMEQIKPLVLANTKRAFTKYQKELMPSRLKLKSDYSLSETDYTDAQL